MFERLLRWLNGSWSDARAGVLKDEYSDAMTRLANADEEERVSCYLTMHKLFKVLSANYGSFDQVDVARKKLLVAELHSRATERLSSDRAEAYACALIRMWVESHLYDSADAIWVKCGMQELLDRIAVDIDNIAHD